MKLSSSLSLCYRLLILPLALTTAVVCCIAVSAAPMPKGKEKENDPNKIDAGSFGVFQKGRSVGTETFSIEQPGYGSVIRSEFKTENAPTVNVQTSEMQLTSKGDIRRYEWKELSPGSAQSTVLPNDDFLNQKWTSGAGEKEHEQPYLLPVSTTILDDYFFVHREVLAWTFLGMVCKQDKGQLQCLPRQHTQFATLNPHQQAQSVLTAEFIGREKITLKDGPQDLLKVELKNDAGTWQLWLNDQFKVLRISVVGENTVVDRD